MTKLKVSQSKVGMWRKCHAAFNYRYAMRLRRKRKERPLVFGDIVHQMLEADANGDDAFEKLKEIEASQGKMFRSMEEEYGRIVEDITDIMTDYFSYWGDHGHLDYVRMRKKQAEFTFEVEIDKDIVAVGKIDNIARTPNKLRWLVEHKTGKNMPTEDHRWKNIQSALYTRIVEMADIAKIDGTLWDFIRSKPPSRPKVKKDGELSIREIDTLPARITRYLEENDRDPKAFQAMMEKAEANRGSYFSRIFTPTKKKVVDILFADFLASARDIADRGHKLKDRNIGRHCDWCTFEPICRAQIRGNDVDFVIKSEFVVSERLEDEEPDFEA